MIVKLLGHASVYVRAGDNNILMDPWLSDSLLGRFRRFPDPGPLNFDIPAPDLVLLSHHHWDHVHIPTLVKFKKQTRFLIPKNDQLKTILKAMDFQNVQEVEPWEEVNFPWGTLWPTKSRVPFGEVGFILKTSDGVLWNMVDTVFSEQEIEKAKEVLGSSVQVCLAPYQNFDEMEIIMRSNQVDQSNLASFNAYQLVGLDADLIVPFADGLYYPGFREMNSTSFMQSPFSFIDYIHSFNPAQRCLVPIPFDEFHLNGGAISFKRALDLDIQSIMEIYDQYRKYDARERIHHIPERVDGLQCSQDSKSIKFDFRSYYQAHRADFFTQIELRENGVKQSVMELFRSLGLCWSLQTEEGDRIIELDFTKNPIQIVEGESRANCGLVIQAKDLVALLETRELLSILTQSCSITTWGNTKARSYHALNVLWYAGFEDSLRLHKYIENCIEEVA